MPDGYKDCRSRLEVGITWTKSPELQEMMTIRDEQGSVGEAGTPAPGFLSQEELVFQIRKTFEKIGIWL